MAAITVTIQHGILPAELRGRRAIVRHDFQTTDVDPDYYPRTWQKCQTLPPEKWYGLPETEKLGDAAFEPLTEAWQRFWFDWLTFYAPVSMSILDLKQAWADLLDGGKAFTNKHGSDAFADHINGTNLDKPPMSQETITTGGNVVILSGNTRLIGGQPFTGVLCLDRSALPPDLTQHAARDYFIHSATVCRPEKATQVNSPRSAPAPHGTFRVDNFPHSRGNKVPVPLVSARGAASMFMGLRVRENWIRDSRISVLADDEFPAPTVR